MAVVGVGGCLRPEPAGSVTVLSSWVGADGDALKKVLSRFKEKYGIRPDFQGTRAFSQVLRSAVDNGTPPDIAVLPSPGELANYVRRRAVHELDSIPGLSQEDSYTRQWQQLQKVGQQHLYSITIAVALKSLVWFNPKHFKDEPPKTGDELIRLSTKMSTEGYTPWCLGLGDGPNSGWSGTDWIEDILLHQSGALSYEMWSAGTLPWTSGEMRNAWTTWRKIVAAPNVVYGGAGGALLTDVVDAARPMFDDPPGCFLHHQATFAMGHFRRYKDGQENSPNLVPKEDFDFFPFPRFASGGGAREVSGNLAAMFNNTPQARKLIEYLATEEAQGMLTAETEGSIFSANRQVAANEAHSVSSDIAKILTDTNAELCFDASDLMPKAMTNAFYQAVLEFLQHPDKLEDLLRQLDEVRESVDPSEWLRLGCGR
jgi:alpha-glucoside transport system substrate-binding protein